MKVSSPSLPVTLPAEVQPKGPPAEPKSQQAKTQAASGPAPSRAPITSETMTELLAATEEAPVTTEAPDAAGKNARSPAWQARAAIEANPELANLPFGKVVSQLARGLSLDELLVPAEPVEVIEEAQPPVEELVVAEPDETPPAEETPPLPEIDLVIETPQTDPLLDLLTPENDESAST